MQKSAKKQLPRRRRGKQMHYERIKNKRDRPDTEASGIKKQNEWKKKFFIRRIKLHRREKDIVTKLTYKGAVLPPGRRGLLCWLEYSTPAFCVPLRFLNFCKGLNDGSERY